MACAKTFVQTLAQLTLITLCYADPEPQLDLPPLPQVSTQRNPYGISSTTPSQYDLNRNFNQFSTPRQQGITPGVYPVSSTPGINPDINNNGYPSLDYGNGRGPTSTVRPYDDRSRDDRIDINNDANFRRNDPNFVRNDPNYVGTNPYNFNRELNNNHIDDRINQATLQRVRDFLLQAEDQASKECTNNVAAQWNFETDVNDATQHAAVSIDDFSIFSSKIRFSFLVH